MNSEYKGKPTAYLDHNIIDILSKNINHPLLKIFYEKFQVIYSDETLNEINRSGYNAHEFLDVLARLNAMYLKMDLTPQFELTGDALLHQKDPNVAFKEFRDNIEPVYENIDRSMSQSLLKFYGGREGSNFDDINNEQIEAFDDLLASMIDESEKLNEEFAEIKQNIKLYSKKMEKGFREALAQSTIELRKHVNNEESYSGVQYYREMVGLGPKQLNNIKPPNVIRKIWEIYKELNEYRHGDFTIEQFLGVSENPIYNREMYLHEKVTSAYNVLNVIGYYPDSKMKKDRRFTAAMSDAGHASMATFANYLISKDSPFVKKTMAIYEFLNIKTTIIEVEERLKSVKPAIKAN